MIKQVQKEAKIKPTCDYSSNKSELVLNNYINEQKNISNDKISINPSKSFITNTTDLNSNKDNEGSQLCN